MTSTVAKGLENLEALKEQAKETLPDIPVQLLPTDLPSGWRFRDIKHKHLLMFYDAEPLSQKYKSIFHEAQTHITAAINAGYFELPTAVTPAVLDDMDWQDVKMLQRAVLNRTSNAINTPKN